MLKKIKSSQIRQGMYVQELCTSWMSSPFWQKSFPIDNQTTIEKIIDAGIRELWIDTDKGCDVLEVKPEVEKVVEIVAPTPQPEVAAPIG